MQLPLYCHIYCHITVYSNIRSTDQQQCQFVMTLFRLSNCTALIQFSIFSFLLLFLFLLFFPIHLFVFEFKVRFIYIQMYSFDYIGCAPFTTARLTKGGWFIYIYIYRETFVFIEALSLCCC